MTTTALHWCSCPHELDAHGVNGCDDCPCKRTRDEVLNGHVETVLGREKAALAIRSPIDRVPAHAAATDETSLVSACSRALQTVNQTQSVAVKVSVVRDMAAVKAVAKAYRMSAETQRRSAEIAILCLRSLGTSLADQYPGKTHRERGEEIGLDTNTCCSASVLASYTDDALDAAFVILEERKLAVGPTGVIARLRDADPEFKAARAREVEDRQARIAESERLWKSDPLYAPTTDVWNEFNGNARALARHIAELRLTETGLAWPASAKSCDQAMGRIELLESVADDEDYDHKHGDKEADAFDDDERTFFVSLRACLGARRDRLAVSVRQTGTAGADEVRDQPTSSEKH